MQWPSSLPLQLDQDGYQETAAPGVLRSTFDGLRNQARQRFSSGPRPVHANLTLTGAEADILDDFYRNSTSGGTKRFIWINPTNGASATIRFLSAPELSAVGPNSFVAALKLEILRS